MNWLLFLWTVAPKLTSPRHNPGKWKAFLTALIAWGPTGLLILAALDSAGLPIVGGVDLLLVNIAAARPSSAVAAALCAIAGSMVGSVFLFGIARKGGEVMLSRYIASKQGARLHRWFERYGMITVFIPALSPLPLPMKIPVFCAGALRVRLAKFTAVVLAARSLRYAALAFFGMRYGARTILYLRQHLLLVSLFALSLAALAVIVLQLHERRMRTRQFISQTASPSS